MMQKKRAAHQTQQLTAQMIKITTQRQKTKKKKRKEQQARPAAPSWLRRQRPWRCLLGACVLLRRLLQPSASGSRCPTFSTGRHGAASGRSTCQHSH